MRNTKVSCKAKGKQAARPNAGRNDDRVASTWNETNPSKRRREYNRHLDDGGEKEQRKRIGIPRLPCTPYPES